MRRRAWGWAGPGTCARENWAAPMKANAVVSVARSLVLAKNDFMPRNIIGLFLFQCCRKVRCGRSGLPGAKNKVLARTGRGRRLSILDRRAHLSRVVQA